MKTRFSLGLILSALLMGGCGNTSGLGEGVKEVDGSASVISQCPLLGSFSSPQPVRLGFQDCPGVGSLGLAQPPAALVLQADCRKKILTVRTSDRLYSGDWEFLPDGRFNFSGMEIGGLLLKGDPSGGTCVAYTAFQLAGNVDCANPDKPVIQYDSSWWLAKGTPPTAASGGSRASGPRTCNLPTSCVIQGTGTVKQCQ